MNEPLGNKIGLQTAVLLAGILLGFLLGRISLPSVAGPSAKTAEPASTLQITQQAAEARSGETAKVQETVKNVSPDDDPSIGSDTAKLLIVEFTDYQCPFCKKYFEESYGQIKENYIDTGKARYVVRDFPLDIHPQAVLAAQAAGCAGEQKKYWEMHDLLFAKQAQWSFKDDAAGTFEAFARELELNAADFDICLQSGKYETEIAEDLKDGELYKVRATPTFFINGKKIVGAQPYRTFSGIMEDELQSL